MTSRRRPRRTCAWVKRWNSMFERNICREVKRNIYQVDRCIAVHTITSEPAHALVSERMVAPIAGRSLQLLFYWGTFPNRRQKYVPYIT